jgi:hypothetical protein
MAGRFAEKVAGAAGIAAQAASGAVSAMSQAVKAASGAAAGFDHAHQQAGGRDASPVSDDATVDELEKGDGSSGGAEWGQQVADTTADTAKAGQVDTASGTATEESVRLKTEQGGYRQAANRLMDIEGLPRKDDSGISSGGKV